MIEFLRSVSTMPENIRNVRQTQKPGSVVVWGGVFAREKTPLVFVPEGVKINAKNYEEHILEPVVKNLSETMFLGGQFLFQQDGASVHTSKRAQRWLRDSVSDFLAKEEWLPSSPELNPMHFCLGKECMHKTSFNSERFETIVGVKMSQITHGDAA